MKLIAVAALVAVCLTLLAGKDDIRRFRRMRQM
jgi:type IV secretory pathway VirB2 component (pilin)